MSENDARPDNRLKQCPSGAEAQQRSSWKNDNFLAILGASFGMVSHISEPSPNMEVMHRINSPTS